MLILVFSNIVPLNGKIWWAQLLHSKHFLPFTLWKDLFLLQCGQGAPWNLVINKFSRHSSSLGIRLWKSPVEISLFMCDQPPTTQRVATFLTQTPVSLGITGVSVEQTESFVL